ncbi:DNA translocase FtsK [Parasegetibacter sp. NRK P23]|uniref:FtsK/SpoIIIE family DNA translocase n=1 Tax=Parasegetibacter sp. NRK P23 TaxID=2942999 RepID=UPI002043DB36|nr:DNA translocase FtsK [Parasegetibacter sp. NRK P23]MCM5528896.1 DNA translocase FtsK [Parasegetibacter sp. NRK P23]
MASKVRKSKYKAPDPDQLTPEKEPEVKMKEVAKDERTRKILGAFCLLVAFFLFFAFSSYLFTWEVDQDQVFREGAGILMPNDLKIANLLGALGAYISHIFFYKGFGIASYLFCTFFFMLGVNLLFERQVFSLKRNIRYVITGLLVLSVLAAFIGQSFAFPWGGAVGDMVCNWLNALIGKTGTAAVILLAAFCYVVWRFNPRFAWPEKKLAAPAAVPVAVPESEETEVEKEIPVVAPVVPSGNQLKGKGGIVVIPPKMEEPVEIPLTLIEKEMPAEEPVPAFEILHEEEPEEEILEEALEEEPEAEDELVPFEPDPEEEIPTLHLHQQGLRKPDPLNDLALEIKSAPEPDPETEENPVAHLAPYEPTLDLRDYKYPHLELLEAHGSEKIIQDPAELEANKNQIINTLKNYDINIQKISATVGPTVTLYEIVPAAGVRISRIKNLEDDIALSLAALGIRIIAPIPGKGTIGIEVPNVKKTVVSMKTLLASEKFQHNAFSLPIAVGKKIDNENFIVDLASMPHLLMAGATGQGKSVGLNAILVSLLYKKHPSQLKLVLVDPKKVELSVYRMIEKHFLAKLPGEEEAIITDTKKVISTLNALCIEMDNRYDLLKEAGCRNIKEYNEKFVKRKLNPQKGHQFLPFIVLVVDEFADLIMTAGKEVEMPIARLAQLARAVGIHLIIATQRPSVNIITGTIKANFPARIAFKVSSKIDSRTILDAGGAEQLIGKGDMLISYNGEITRLQCAFVDTPEVDKITEFIGDQRGYPQAFLLPEYVDEKEMDAKDFQLGGDRDELFEDAARLIVANQMGSTSLIQRRMKLGYNRAGRLMDQLEAAGIVGPGVGSKAREVLIKTEYELEQFLEESR